MVPCYNNSCIQNTSGHCRIMMLDPLAGWDIIKTTSQGSSELQSDQRPQIGD